MRTNLFDRIVPHYNIAIHSWTPLPRAYPSRVVGLVQVTVNGQHGFLFLRSCNRIDLRLSYFQAGPVKEDPALEAVRSALRRWLEALPRDFEALPVSGPDRQGEIEFLCPLCGQRGHHHGYPPPGGHDAGGFRRVGHCGAGFLGSRRHYRLAERPFDRFSANLRRRWTIYQAGTGEMLLHQHHGEALDLLRNHRRGINTDRLVRLEPFRSLYVPGSERPSLRLVGNQTLRKDETA